LNNSSELTNQNYTSALLQTESSSDKARGLHATPGSENPSYVALWANEDFLSLLAQTLSNDATLTSNNLLLPLGPSSTMIMEFTLQDVLNAEGATTNTKDIFV
jgi:hypothetical protein